jgi:hypothetical protein
MNVQQEDCCLSEQIPLYRCRLCLSTVLLNYVTTSASNAIQSYIMAVGVSPWLPSLVLSASACQRSKIMIADVQGGEGRMLLGQRNSNTA